MSEAGALPHQSAPSAPVPGQKISGPKLLTELKVSGHLMTLDPGLFCIVQGGTGAKQDSTGLPGVRVSLPPGPVGQPQAVSITSFRADGWLGGGADAALVRVSDTPAQILVTIYQAANAPEAAPRLQVLRLGEATAPQPAAAASAPQPQAAAFPPQAGAAPGQPMPDVIAHVRIKGDVGVALGDWVGERGSKRWIEGFMIAPQQKIAARDIEYQAVLGRGWLSPWVEGGQLCGSRGMALPLLGVRFRLRGAAAEAFDISYSATFIDGTEIGPVGSGEPCEAESLAPLEAFQVVLTPRAKAGGASRKPEPKLAAPSRSAPPAARGGRAAKAKPARRGR